ncbi:MAG TPA: hypothetical protein VLF63_00715 [Patescibacteria group bacterium]|nr:hypothetical protein [Patescibacteria group bacterium]
MSERNGFARLLPVSTPGVRTEVFEHLTLTSEDDTQKAGDSSEYMVIERIIPLPITAEVANGNGHNANSNHSRGSKISPSWSRPLEVKPSTPEAYNYIQLG